VKYEFLSFGVIGYRDLHGDVSPPQSVTVSFLHVLSPFSLSTFHLLPMSIFTYLISSMNGGDKMGMVEVATG